MDKQEYYYNGSYVTIFSEVTDHPDLVIVSDGGDYGELLVVRKDVLKKKEESYQYQQAQKRADELRLITQKAQENLDKLTDKLVDKAIISLASRIKFNVAFGSGGSAAPYALMLSQELEKMIKKDAPKVIAEKEDVFA